MLVSSRRRPLYLDRRWAVAACSDHDAPRGLLPRRALAVDETARDHQEVAGAGLDGSATTLAELDRHGTRDHIDDRVVAPVMVPAAHEAGLGRREPRSQARLRERLTPVDLGRALDLDEFVRSDPLGVLRLAHTTTSLR